MIPKVNEFPEKSINSILAPRHSQLIWQSLFCPTDLCLIFFFGLDQNDFVEVRCGRGWGWLSGRLLLFIGAQQTYTHTHTRTHTRPFALRTKCIL